jgi:hypothetical protein
MLSEIKLFQGIWEEIEEEFEKLRRRRVPRRVRRFDTERIYKDLMSLPPGSERKTKIPAFVKTYAIDLSGLSPKQVKKRIRSVLRAAVRRGILSEFHTFGDLIIIRRSELTEEEIRERMKKAEWWEEILEEEE